MSPITAFRGEHKFLSNFHYAVVELDGTRYFSVENAYQASKVPETLRRPFQKCTPSRSKTLSRELGIRPDFDTIKIEIMRGLLLQKFSPGSDLAGKLLATGFVELIEGNTWNDTFWGVCRGVGSNNLGKLLMYVRSDLLMKSMDPWP